MNRILISSYPNREIRLTLVREQIGKRETYETQDDPAQDSIAADTLTCPSLKTLQAPKKPRQSGDSGDGKPPGFGGLPRPQKFSLHGRRQILRSGGALQKILPKENCLFLTLTLPGSTKGAMEAMARYSGMSVQMLQRWLSYHIPSKLSIYTWEWQKRGALHLHMVVGCPDRGKGEWIRDNLQREWIRILDRISQESGVDVYAKNKGFSWVTDKSATRVDAQWCEQDVAGYLSKYVSKAHKANKSMGVHSYYPSRWYGVSRPLLQALKERTVSVSVDSLRERDSWSMYTDVLSVLQQWGVKCYEYSHTVGIGKTIVAYALENEQESLWETIMNQISTTPDFSSNTERNLRRLARNGCILMKKHKTWLESFTQFYSNSRPMNLLNLPSYKDISRNDLLFLLDALAFTYRYTQRTRLNLPGACQLWYSQTKESLETATPDEKEWIGALRL